MLLVDTEIKPSAIHGIGLFCREPLPKGTKVWEFHPLFDIMVNDAETTGLPPTAHSFLKTYAYRSIETNSLILNLDLSRHMNHSDQPTLVADGDSNYYAAYDLPADTELTCDYRDFTTPEYAEFLAAR